MVFYRPSRDYRTRVQEEGMQEKKRNGGGGKRGRISKGLSIN